MKAKHLREFLIRPVLQSIHTQIPYSSVAEDLMLATACAESYCGQRLRQETNDGYGPAKGVFQMEGATESDIWDNYLDYRPELSELTPPAQLGLYSNEYAAFMCRVHYYRAPAELPAYNRNTDYYLEALGQYWKEFYNTEKGAGTVEGFIKKCNKYGDFRTCH